MLKSKNTSLVCFVIIALTVIITLLFMFSGSLGVLAVQAKMPYEDTLFSTDKVHTLDITVDTDEWSNLLQNATNKEYISCMAAIDGEILTNIAIRAKGNSTLSSIASSDSDRYSFKVEFDHYVKGQTYQGLDKLVLNNIAQDNTYMKDYLCYQMMNYFDADAPLTSFIYITINGEDWGLYLAVEGVEDAFLERNYGNENGNLYKPESDSMFGGGKMENNDFAGGNRQVDEQFNEQFAEIAEKIQNGEIDMEQMFGQFEENRGANRGGGNFAMGGMNASDVALKYTDDTFESYENIWSGAKTDITDEDKARLISSLKQMNNGENLNDVLDVEEVLRYFVVHNFVLNFDSYTGSMLHNYYLYENDGQLSMIAWDYNLAFGAFAMGSSDSAGGLVNYPIDTPLSGASLEDRPLLNALFNDEACFERYHELFSELMKGFFDGGDFASLYDNAISLISPYVEKDPTAFCSYDEFIVASEMLREFCLLRAESIKGQLEGTIPSTSEGQTADSTSLITADDIDISVMGSNGRGFNMSEKGNFGGFGGINNFKDRKETVTANGENTLLMANAIEGGIPNMGDFGGAPPDMPNMGEAPPNMPNMGDMPSMGEIPADFESDTTSDNEEQTKPSTNSDNNTDKAGQFNFQNQQPQDTKTVSTDNENGYLWILGSAAFLSLGLIFAKLAYRK